MRSVEKLWKNLWESRWESGEKVSTDLTEAYKCFAGLWEKFGLCRDFHVICTPVSTGFWSDFTGVEKEISTFSTLPIITTNIYNKERS